MCPYCKEKTIKYGQLIKCWTLSDVKCLNCSATIKYKKKYRIIDISIICVEAVCAFLCIDYFGEYFRCTTVGLLLLPSCLFRCITSYFAELTYEIDAKHKENNETGTEE